MKCIVIETSPERTNAHTVTNEDGSAHIYATMAEARAELKGNGYKYNRANDRYYLADAPEYRAYIIRDDSDEYAEAIEKAETERIETAEQNAAELEERAEIIAAIEDDQQRDYIEAEATAHQWTPDETRAAIEYRAAITAANRAALALLDAYAEAIGEYPEEDDPETVAAYRVARDEITGTSSRATEYDRATVAAMIEAIAAAAEPEPEPRTARHYYAERSPYGVSTLSDGDTLTRFATKQEREQWCSIDPEHRAPVTLAEVRHRYDVRQFAASQETPAHIHHRPRYQL